MPNVYTSPAQTSTGQWTNHNTLYPYQTIGTVCTWGTSTTWPTVSPEVKELQEQVEILEAKVEAMTELIKVATDRLNEIEMELNSKNETNSDTRQS